MTRRAAAPRNPRRLPRRRSTYVLLCVVTAPIWTSDTQSARDPTTTQLTCSPVAKDQGTRSCYNMVVKGTGTRTSKPAPTAPYINAVARMEVDEGLSVGNFLTDIGTRANQEEPRSSIAQPECRRTPPTWREVYSKETMDSEFSIAKRRQVNQDNPRGGGHRLCCGKGRYRHRYAYESGRAKEFNRPPER